MNLRFQVLLFAFLLGILSLTNRASASVDPTSCDRRLTVRLWETHYPKVNPNASFWDNAGAAAQQKLKDEANATIFTLLVSCDFYENTSVGTNLLTQKFEWGNFISSGGSVLSHWNLKVVDKPYDAQNDNSGPKCEKFVTAELSTIHGLTLDGKLSDTVIDNLSQIARDRSNRVQFKIPVSCKYYDGLSVGNDLMTHFRWGSYVLNNSVGAFRLKIVQK